MDLKNPNLKMLDKATEGLSPNQLRAVNEIVLGWLSNVVPEAEWQAAVKTAVDLAKRSTL